MCSQKKLRSGIRLKSEKAYAPPRNLKFLQTALLVFGLCVGLNYTAFSQTASFIPPGNQNYVSLEKNLLFNAQNRYTVTQSGTRSFALDMMFDGNSVPHYLTGFNGTEANAVSLEISGLPGYHIQLGGYLGFTTRYLPARKFKIEAFDSYDNLNVWKTIADVNDNSQNFYNVFISDGSFTKIRFTFYSGGSGGAYEGWIGISELFFLHSEATKAYDGLLVQYAPNGNVGIGTTLPNNKLQVNSDNTGSGSNNWIAGNFGGLSGDRVVMGLLFGKATIGAHNNGLNAWSNLLINPEGGFVGIGTLNPKEMLSVNGKVRAHEIKVETTNWPDYVFAKEHKLPSLFEVEKFIKTNKHLPEIPSAKEVETDGISLGEMNAKLLKKIEELTLYMIEQEKRNQRQDRLIEQLLKEISKTKNKN